jgi:alkylhydroperoxidase family enzyme
MEATTAPRPRIEPGSEAELGRVNTLITRAIGASVGGAPPRVFTTLGRHRRLFRRWLGFAGALMPGGVLPRRDSELVILRVAHNCESEYERFQHERLGAEAGLSGGEISRVEAGPAAEGWSDRQRLLLAAADELHQGRDISDELWAELTTEFNEVELIELCMLIGHYEMLAMTLNALRVQPDAEPAGQPTGVARIIRKLAERRS